MNDAIQLEDIQDAIVNAEKVPTHEALSRWVKRYPEHQEALTTFFATWAVQTEQFERPAIDEARIGSQMVSNAMDLLHKLASPGTAEIQVPSKLRLYKMINASGLSEDAVMNQCGLDESLLAKLDRRLIRINSIPAICFERLAHAVRSAIDDIKQAISGEPIPLTNYKAKTKPMLKQESFLHAVTVSELTTDAKKEWEQLISSDKALEDEST